MDSRRCIRYILKPLNHDLIANSKTENKRGTLECVSRLILSRNKSH